MQNLSHIYWFAYFGLYSPSVRYRAQYPLAYAESELGISSDLVIPGYSIKRIFHFSKVYFQALLFPKRKSIIVVQRVQSAFIYATLLKFLVLCRPSRSAYDIDDADYLEENDSSIRFFTKHCKVVFAGSRAIAKHLSRWNPNTVFLTSPTPNLGIVKSNRNERFTLGWIGSFGGGHKRSMYDVFLPALRKLDFPITFKILGILTEEDSLELHEYFAGYEHVHLEVPTHVNWENEHWVQEQVSTFDVGIATLEDSELHRSKSGIKAKQCLTNGVPVLATPLPENAWLIEDGMNGFTCSTTTDFEDRIRQIYDLSRVEYNRMSLQALNSSSLFNHTHYWQVINAAFNPEKDYSFIYPKTP